MVWIRGWTGLRAILNVCLFIYLTILVTEHISNLHDSFFLHKLKMSTELQPNTTKLLINKTYIHSSTESNVWCNRNEKNKTSLPRKI
jgi:hypothetical protein